MQPKFYVFRGETCVTQQKNRCPNGQRFWQSEKLLNNLANGAGAGGIGLVGVDVHGQSKLIADADDHVTIDGLATLGGDLDGDDLLVNQTHLGGIGGTSFMN